MKIIITGSAGFIGMHTSLALLKKNFTVIGIDNLNSYYSVKLKKERLKILKKFKNFHFYKFNISQKKSLEKIFKKFKPDLVINFAAQAGVRYSIKYPEKYLKSNIIGFFNIIQLCVKYKTKRFIFASSSSVYGFKENKTNTEEQKTDKQLSYYASTKKSNESMAYTYSHLYKLKTIGLRFFTVYGPWGRPDMALYKFTDKIIKNKKIEIYNKGEMYRSFTYIDDAVKSVIKVINNFDKIDKYKVPFKILNIGTSKSEKLLKFVKLIEKNLKTKALKIFLPIQQGDTNSTKANLRNLKRFTNFSPKTKIDKGIKNFINWYKNYHIKK